jgi:hypothetical protein
MVNFILHAGLHKTATTSLQELVFPAVADVFYTGKSRQVMKIRETPILPFLFHYLQEDSSNIHHLPAHTCAYFASLLQDRVIGRLSRSLDTLQSLRAEITLMHALLERLNETSPNATVLYSCEGLLLCLGHICPKTTLKLTAKDRDQPPLFLFKKLFPGSTKKIVIYVRSPIDYLYSRYIQIHTIKMQKAKRFVMAPSDYLDIQGEIYAGEVKQQSIFYHVFQRELAQDLASLGPEVVIRSYEKHIRDTASISKEINKTFGVEMIRPTEVDKRFKENPLNTTDHHKDEAVNFIINHMGFSNHDQLKQAFRQVAEQHRLVQAALSSRIYP